MVLLFLSVSGAQAWPRALQKVKVSDTIVVNGDFNGGYKMYYGIGDGSQNEHQKPMMTVRPGGTVSNLLVGSPAGDGIHCMGSCSLKNVWWDDVGEDAATFLGSDPRNVYTVSGGGARFASDKVFQFNGHGRLIIENFEIQDSGKLVRSCGTCKTQYPRRIVVRNVTALNVKTVVGINEGDEASISGVSISGPKCQPCTVFKIRPGQEPLKTDSLEGCRIADVRCAGRKA